MGLDTSSLCAGACVSIGSSSSAVPSSLSATSFGDFMRPAPVIYDELSEQDEVVKIRIMQLKKVRDICASVCARVHACVRFEMCLVFAPLKENSI
jgi:hypothetical protein